MSTQALRRLLKRRIREADMSTRRFAEDVMVRDERTVRRWLAGSTIPKVVQRWLRAPWRWPPPDLWGDEQE